MAHTGAEFLFLPFKSGIYHIRTGSRSRSPRLTQKQRVAFQSRLDSGTALYCGSSQQTRTIRKVLALTSFFPFLAQSATAQEFAGAAHLLSQIGFECQGFCPSKWDLGEVKTSKRSLSVAGLPLRAETTTLGPHTAQMLYTRVGRIPVSVFRTRSSQSSGIPQR